MKSFHFLTDGIDCKNFTSIIQKSFFLVILSSLSISCFAKSSKLELLSVSSKELMSKQSKTDLDSQADLDSQKLQTEQAEQMEGFDKDGNKNKDPNNTIAENFYDKNSQVASGENFWSDFFENHSWFFDKKRTKRKIAIFPYFRYTDNYGTILGLRAFSYSLDKQGYYIGISLSKPISYDRFRLDFSFTSGNHKGTSSETYISFSNYPEFYYGYGIDTKESDIKTLYSTVIYAEQIIKFRAKNNIFYNLIGEFVSRKEDKKLQEEIIYFQPEFIATAEVKFGYDSRDSWKDPSTGFYSYISYSCTPSLGQGSSFCKGGVDLRAYRTFLEQYRVAVRAFTGSSFFGPSSYSLSYSLGGSRVLRGFSESRFRGHKIYAAQGEVHAPVPYLDPYLSVVGFAEIGEVAMYKESFKKTPQSSLGLGLRLAMPPDYKMKIRLDLGYAIADKEKPFHFLIDFFQAF